MTDVYPYEKRYKYPHMMPYDVAIWERLIEAFPKAYDRVQYDVGLGTVPEFVTGHEDEAMRGQEALYKRKIDVVGYRNDEISIIEIKPRAGLSAIGQVLGYKTLYVREFNPPGRIRAIIVTDSADDDTKHVAATQGVEIIEV